MGWDLPGCCGKELLGLVLRAQAARHTVLVLGTALVTELAPASQRERQTCAVADCSAHAVGPWALLGVSLCLLRVKQERTSTPCQSRTLRS